MNKLQATVSLDLDNTWTYLMIHGSEGWEAYPSHFKTFMPLILDFLDQVEQKITFFIVGKDAEIDWHQSYFEEMTRRGHEVGNHSYHHEPWMEQWSEDQVFQELHQADRAIIRATGKKPVGFRGPGFCRSQEMHNAVQRMNYLFDASVLATSIAPIARMYYFWKMDKGSVEKRENLFGRFSAVFQPNRPHFLENGLLEIPVTTIPMVRTPFHLSYLLWLAQFSERGAFAYLKSAIALCKFFHVPPSFLLHPPDFMGLEELPELGFFPAIRLSMKYKLDFAQRVFHELNQHFELVPMSAGCLQIEEQLNLRHR